MKKSDLVKVIREIVRQEVKKELPKALATVFQNLMNGDQPKQVHGMNVVRNIAPSEPPVPIPQEPMNEMDQWKMQLREMIDGNVDVPRTTKLQEQVTPQPQAPQPRQFTKDPKINAILNATRPFNSTERGQPSWANSPGGMSPAVAMAGQSFAPPSMPETGVGQVMDDNELTFLKNIPGMPGADDPVVAAPQPQMVNENHTPMESLGEASALDIKNHPALPDSIKGILNRDYRSLVKAMDKKK